MGLHHSDKNVLLINSKWNFAKSGFWNSTCWSFSSDGHNNDRRLNICTTAKTIINHPE